LKTSRERIEHHICPQNVVNELRLAGGVNRFNEPNYRVVWGYDRIVPIHGEWQEWERYQGTLTDKFTGHAETRQFVKLANSVIETRLLPKYLPGNCWHLEQWRPPEEYGTREEWSKRGEEIIGTMTIDTSGPYPERGEYELVYPLTDDGTSHGTSIPLVNDVVVEIVRLIQWNKGRHTFLERRAAIEQRVRREEEGYVNRAKEVMREGMHPYAGEAFVTVPEGTGDKNESS
jgi:hypothetical protein